MGPQEHSTETRSEAQSDEARTTHATHDEMPGNATAKVEKNVSFEVDMDNQQSIQESSANRKQPVSPEPNAEEQTRRASTLNPTASVAKS